MNAPNAIVWDCQANASFLHADITSEAEIRLLRHTATADYSLRKYRRRKLILQLKVRLRVQEPLKKIPISQL